MYLEAVTYVIRGLFNIMKCRWEVPNTSVQYNTKCLINVDGGWLNNAEWEILYVGLKQFQFLKNENEGFFSLDIANTRGTEPGEYGIFNLLRGEHTVRNSV
jgi:hypothetical protein